ncbi:hypothetical protein [Agromyces lapidis]|uniref:Uncharacterized protein n=1 Tax=Agromyces lapidis TaxID=279574 RepID=A0ABV5SME6_9MICO|nr:hypothetical protein [Agromyces lapidis]
MAETNYRATVVRSDGNKEDWGFFAFRVNDAGVAAFRSNESTRDGDFDHFLAPGSWVEIRDIYPEA